MGKAEGGRALTKRVVDAARYSGTGRSQCILWDGELRGFGLRVQPTGRKSWIVFYRTAGGTKRLTSLGHYPDLTPDLARRAALRALADVSGGADPATDRQHAREAASFATLAKDFLERHSKIHKKSSRDDERYLKRVLIPALGTRKAAAVARADLSALHRRIGARTPYAANRMLATASMLFAWGEREGYVAAGHPNPAHGIRKFRETKRDRWVTPTEMPKLAAAILAEPSEYVRAALWLYLLLGARKTELLRARWEDVDLERGLWRLPETKAGRTHFLPLSPPAVAILAELPREEANPHVFPGRGKGSHLVNIEKAWRRIRKAAECEGLRLHDLRRTCASWLVQAGASLPLIGRVLGHTTAAATSVYARFGDEGARRALEEHAVRIVAAGQPVEPQ